MNEFKFYEKVANKIVRSQDLTEEELHEAKRCYESFFVYTSHLEFEQLPYTQFKVFEYLEIHGYVVKRKRPELKDNFWTENFSVVLVVFCFLFAGLTFSIIISHQPTRQENPSRNY